MQGKVFVSYRRNDSQGSAGRLYDRLARTLGRNAIFFDIESISPGVDFVDVLKQQVGACNALLAIIGTHWIEATNSDGERRLDDATDFVRIEVETALERNIPVIPVLVDGAQMPRVEQLPYNLKGITRRQAIEISHARFDFDADRLFKGLRQTLDQYEMHVVAQESLTGLLRPKPPKKILEISLGAIIVFVLLGVLLLVWHLQTEAEPVKAASPPSSPGQAAPSPSPELKPEARPVSDVPETSATPVLPLSTLESSKEAAPSQADANGLCHAYSFDAILRTENSGVAELQTYRSNLLSGLSRFTPMMNPDDASSSLGYNSLFSTFYGQVEESMPDGYGDRPLKLPEVIARIDRILQEESRMIQYFSNDLFRPVITYLWLFEQGLCNFPDPSKAPTPDQMVNMLLSKNLGANFSNPGEVLFKKIYNQVLLAEAGKMKSNRYRSFWNISRDWRHDVAGEMIAKSRN